MARCFRLGICGLEFVAGICGLGICGLEFVAEFVASNLWPDGTDTHHIHADSQKPLFRLATKLLATKLRLATKLERVCDEL
jgi:hypothetical protein